MFFVAAALSIIVFMLIFFVLVIFLAFEKAATQNHNPTGK